jgi:hypothetical protein
MIKFKLSWPGLLGAAFFVSAAGAAWEVDSEGGRMTYYDLDFDGRPIGYAAGLEDWLRDGDGPFDAFVVTKHAGSWFRYSQFVMGFDYGGLDVIQTGDGAYCFVAPGYVGDGNWEAKIYRFKDHGSAEELKGAPRMQIINAFAISAFDDVWFAGLSYEYPAPGRRIIAHFNGDEWVISEDPSESGLLKLHFFAPNDGWAYASNGIYRFNGTTWYFAGVIPGVDRLEGCDFKSPTDIWAAATKKDRGGVILRYKNGGWREVFAPGPKLYISDVAMWGDDGGWAVGYFYDGYRAYGRIWQCRDGKWTPCACPMEGPVTEVEVLSDCEAWAVGGSTIIHYTTEANVAAYSLGRIKALYAAGRGSDSDGPASNASRVPAASASTTGSGTPTSAGSRSLEYRAENAE